MHLQLTGCPEGLFACLTDVRLVPQVGPFVPGQLSGLSELLVARLTFVCNPRMYRFVLSEMLEQQERLFACHTFVRLGPRMGQFVHSQLAGLHKSALARVTDVRLDPSMDQFVHNQSAGLRKSLLACLAFVRLLPRMDS